MYSELSGIYNAFSLVWALKVGAVNIIWGKTPWI